MNDKSRLTEIDVACSVCGAVRQASGPDIAKPADLKAYLIKYSGSFNALAEAINAMRGYVYVPYKQDSDSAVTVLPGEVPLMIGQVFGEGPDTCRITRVAPLSPP